MVQFLRPVSDEAIGGWTDECGGTTNIRNSIDEVCRCDSDFIITGNNPSCDVYRAEITVGTDPLGNVCHIARYAYGKDAGARVGQILVALLQGSSCVIHEETHDAVAAGFTAGTFTLTSCEADSITSYAQLQVRITANTSGGGSPQQGQVSWFELEIPGDAPTGGRVFRKPINASGMI